MPYPADGSSRILWKVNHLPWRRRQQDPLNLGSIKYNLHGDIRALATSGHFYQTKRKTAIFIVTAARTSLATNWIPEWPTHKQMDWMLTVTDLENNCWVAIIGNAIRKIKLRFFPLLDTVLSHINPNINTSYFWNILFCIILLTLSYSSIRPSFGNFPTKKKSYNFYYFFLGLFNNSFSTSYFVLSTGAIIVNDTHGDGGRVIIRRYYTRMDWGRPQETSVALIKLQSKLTNLGHLQ